jgi:hypothetical protein
MIFAVLFTEELLAAMESGSVVGDVQLILQDPVRVCQCQWAFYSICPALEDHLSASARTGPVEAILHRSETNRQIVVLSVFGRDKTFGGWVQLSWTKGGGIKIGYSFVQQSSFFFCDQVMTTFAQRVFPLKTGSCNDDFESLLRRCGVHQSYSTLRGE